MSGLSYLLTSFDLICSTSFTGLRNTVIGFPEIAFEEFRYVPAHGAADLGILVNLEEPAIFIA